MIDNFFSKVGFYEIVSSLIAGIYEISIIAFSLYYSFYEKISFSSIKNIIFKINDLEISFFSIIFILLISFFIGLFFNELGDILKPLLRKYDTLFFIRVFFKNNHWLLTDLELKLAEKIIIYNVLNNNYLESETYDDEIVNIDKYFIFNYSNTYLSLNLKNNFIRKMQTLSAFFRGLIIYSALLIIILLVFCFVHTPINVLQFLFFIFILMEFTFIILPVIENKYRKLLEDFTIRYFIINLLYINPPSDTSQPSQN
ncbi:hypothetical protein DW938_12280 [Ruminococcus sp. AM43-6]|jgi:hypothetical protein|uniref:hypothetical protein n=1 Tax=Ruminococcus sp. AM43-6 TaxID=2293216 RepID=UPI000E46FCA3|nr:hypothetical protein [Ruminococcus sp. AM43-6]MBT9625021.1 hypothetical protein [Ruminococcus bicirculans (ex Wegman et al. 2014)]RGH34634.1 hypothetical protein DW938_12280 [Ruminococcus sp. AM43-6]UYJ31542.1 MAG: hypothetical protein OGM18_13375 [Oscillospiraceae bacterium]